MGRGCVLYDGVHLCHTPVWMWERSGGCQDVCWCGNMCECGYLTRGVHMHDTTTHYTSISHTPALPITHTTHLHTQWVGPGNKTPCPCNSTNHALTTVNHCVASTQPPLGWSMCLGEYVCATCIHYIHTTCVHNQKTHQTQLLCATNKHNLFPPSTNTPYLAA